MSELKDMCVSLAVAKALVEAGIKGDSVYAYGKSKYYEGTQIEMFGIFKKRESHFTRDIIIDDFGHRQDAYEIYPAPTFDELEKDLTNTYHEYNIKIHTHYSDGKVMIECWNWNSGNYKQTYKKSQWHENKAETMAEVLIELKKEGLI